MRVDIVGSADARAARRGFPFPGARAAPASGDGRPRARGAPLGDAGKEQLVGIELGGGLGDALALLLEQLRQRSRLGLAALGELHLDLREALVGKALQRRQEIGDVALDERLHARRRHVGRRPGIAQRLLELVQGALLAAFAERAQRFAVALGLGPDRGDRDDLLVQPRGAGAVDRKPPHQHHARLRAGAFNHGNARQAGLEALATGSATAAAGPADVRGGPAPPPARRGRPGSRGGSKAMARMGTRWRHSLIRSPRLRGRARRSSKVSCQPASLAKAGSAGSKVEGGDIADGLAPGAIERSAGARQGGADHAHEVVGADADALARVLASAFCSSSSSFRSRS